jgi:hypothetical protein
MFLAMLASIVVVALGAIAPQNPWHQWNVDLVMRAYSGTTLFSGERERFVIVDVDDISCGTWRLIDAKACEPNSRLLREKVASALKVVTASNAKATVLDMYAPPLSPSDDTGSRAAKDELQEAVASARGPLFVARSIRRVEGTDDYEEVPSLFDTIENNQLKFGHVNWTPDRDGVIRRAMPSIEVSSVALKSGKTRALCGISALVAQSIAPQVHPVPCSSNGEFVFDVAQPPPFWIALLGRAARKDEFSILERVSLFQIDRLDAVGRQIFNDAIVVFGSSRQAAGEIYETPLGSLSGPEIIVNHIHALVNLPPLEEPPVLYRLVEKTKIASLGAFVIYAFWTLTVIYFNRSTKPTTAAHREALSKGVYRPSRLRLLCSGLILAICMAFLAAREVSSAGISMQNGLVVEPFTPIFGLMIEVAMDVGHSVVELARRTAVFLTGLIQRLLHAR